MVKYNDIEGNKYWGIKIRGKRDPRAKENVLGMPGGPDKGPEPITYLIPPCYSQKTSGAMLSATRQREPLRGIQPVALPYGRDHVP